MIKTFVVIVMMLFSTLVAHAAMDQSSTTMSAMNTTKDEITKKAAEQLKAWLLGSDLIEAVELRSVSQLSDRSMQQLQKADRYSIRAWRDDERLKARICVWVELWRKSQGSSKKSGSIPIWFSVNATGKLWVFNQPVYADRTVTPNHLTLQRSAELSRLQGRPIIDLSTLMGKKLKQKVNPGQALIEELLVSRPAVEIGKPVKVITQSGPIVIESTAESLNNGEIGQSVRLQAPGSEKSFWGTVKDRNVVWVR